MHIFYHKANGALYARLGHSVRNGDKVSKESINLGRVLDKEKGIYKSRERGVFQYDLETDTYTSISAPEEDTGLSLPGKSGREEKSGRPGKKGGFSSRMLGAEKAIVDLGDVFLLDRFLANEGIKEIVDAMGYEERDTLYALLCHRLLDKGDDLRAADWYEGSYASILYPHAELSGQRIDGVYAWIGGELARQLFFSRYLSSLSERAIAEERASRRELAEREWAGRHGAEEGAPGSRPEDGYILIDSAGAQEGRLIYVVRQSTGLPVYFRYCEEREADVDTLVRTIRELEAYKIMIKLAILDAGYYSGDSIEELYAYGIAFITKPREDLKLYKKLATDSLSALAGQENFVSCDVRYPYIKCVSCKVGRKNHPACAYVCLAMDQERLEAYRRLLDTKNRSLTDGDMHDMIQAGEILLFVSSEKVAPDKLLAAYGTRRYMEPYLAGPLAENGRELADLPKEAQGITAICGQLLLTFIADIVQKRLEAKLQGSPYTLGELFLSLRNQKGKVYKDWVIAQKASKKASDGYKWFGIACPSEIRR